jgi:hypothetical protein
MANQDVLYFVGSLGTRMISMQKASVPDTPSKVIQHRRGRSPKERSAVDVNNFAAPKLNDGGKLSAPFHTKIQFRFASAPAGGARKK